MEHSQACIERTNAVKKAISEYEEKWPNYCRKCNGVGFLVSYQSVPYGMGSTNMEVDDFCSCVEEGKCPRCGIVVFDEDDFDDDKLECPKCGWTEESPICPELDDCGCWESSLPFI